MHRRPGAAAGGRSSGLSGLTLTHGCYAPQFRGSRYQRKVVGRGVKKRQGHPFLAAYFSQIFILPFCLASASHSFFRTPGSSKERYAPFENLAQSIANPIFTISRFFRNDLFPDLCKAKMDKNKYAAMIAINIITKTSTRRLPSARFKAPSFRAQSTKDLYRLGRQVAGYHPRHSSCRTAK